MSYYYTQKELVNQGFTIGTRVEVSHRPDKYYGYSLVGKIGVIESGGSFSSIPVRFVDLDNEASAKGLFYFKVSDLKLVNTNDNDILEENNMPNITNYLNIAKIQYVDNTATSRYDYANFDPELKAGDLCVVMSANHGMGLAKVVEIIDQNDIETPREIVAKVNADAYYERVNVRSKAAELKAKMQERAKKLQDIALFQMLAKEDSEMAEMLKAYQGLI